MDGIHACLLNNTRTTGDNSHPPQAAWAGSILHACPCLHYADHVLDMAMNMNTQIPMNMTMYTTHAHGSHMRRSRSCCTVQRWPLILLL
jgi:hypothetical protein